MCISVVERQKAGQEDDHVEDKRHVHVHVDHGTDHSAPVRAQVPRFNCVVVNSEGDCEQKYEVGEDQVEDGDGCGGNRAVFHGVDHQAQASSAAEQNH